jgi:hypothetical protein
MPMNLLFPPIWNLIESFKKQCCSIGWETCESEDWIKTGDGKYHLLLWTKTIHSSTFEKIVNRGKCGISRGNSYEVVEIAYISWLFEKSPPENLFTWIKENPELKRKIAIFDLSGTYTGTNICRRFNQTESNVFKEFEKFLQENWDIDFKSPYEIPTIAT